MWLCEEPLVDCIVVVTPQPFLVGRGRRGGGTRSGSRARAGVTARATTTSQRRSRRHDANDGVDDGGGRRDAKSREREKKES